MKDLCDPRERRTVEKRTLKEMIFYRNVDETRGLDLMGTVRQ